MTQHPPRDEAELVELVRSIDVRAPESLHRRVEALIATRPSRRKALRTLPLDTRRRLATAGALALAAIVIALVAALGGGGGSSRLTLRQASALTLSPATAAAPAEASGGARLAASVEGVSFPYWGSQLRWHSTGQRQDHLGGRTIDTVFYADSRGRRVGYAIVAGRPAPAVSGGTVSWREGTPYRLTRAGDRLVVSWLRDGRLCVLSGRGVDGATLLRLASWGGERATAA